MTAVSYKLTTVTARRDYDCDLCGLIIRQGDRHHLARFMDGEVMRTHLKLCINPRYI